MPEDPRGNGRGVREEKPSRETNEIVTAVAEKVVFFFSKIHCDDDEYVLIRSVVVFDNL